MKTKAKKVVDIKAVSLLMEMIKTAATYTWDNRNTPDGDFMVLINQTLLDLGSLTQDYMEKGLDRSLFTDVPGSAEYNAR